MSKDIAILNKAVLKNSLPVRFLTTAVILTELFIVGFGAHSYQAHHQSQSMKDHDLRVIELRGLILQLDEVLTMSARMAAATGNLEWEKRYKKYEPKLDLAIKEAIRLDPGAYTGQAAKATDEANIRLVQLERDAFELVRRGLLQDGQKILFSEDYEQNKKIYAGGMAQFENRLKEGLEKTAMKESRRIAINLSIMTGVALFLLAGWILVLKAARRWERQLLEINHQLVGKTRELNELNQTLDKKVQERTRELEVSKSLLLQNEKMAAIGQLAGGVAHEINNPLGVILGFSQGMVRRIAPGDPLEMPLKSIEREALRCKNLVQDLLIFSRVEKIQKEPIQLKQAIEEALTLILGQAKVKNVELVTELSEVAPAVANKNQIQQVVVNLANNAVDAMPRGGKLTIRLRSVRMGDEEGAEIHIQDTGEGIPPEIHSKIFNPFFTTKEVGKGTGLGLALVYEIVAKHKGQIVFESEVGKGTLFRVRLPLNPAQLEMPLKK